MNLETLIILAPAIIGLIIAILNKDSINQYTENIEELFKNKHASISSNSHWFKRIVLKPLYWLIVKFSNWTDSFSNRGLKNGVRFALSLYLILIWIFLIINAFVMVVALFFIYAVFSILIKSNSNSQPNYNTNNAVLGIPGKGRKIDQETGIIQEKGLFGYNNTNKRINPETGKIQNKGLFGWEDSKTKIDQESGIIQKKGLFGFDDTNTRVNPETGIIQTKSVFGWNDTNERINLETGKHQEKSIFGWNDK